MGIIRGRLKSFLESSGVVLEGEFQFSHRVVAVAADEVGSGAVGEVDFLGEVLHCLVVLVDAFVADSSVVQVLQVLGVAPQRHRVVADGLVEQAYPHVAVGPVGVALAAHRVQFDFFRKVLDRLWEPFHFAVDESDVGVGDGVVGVEGEGLQEVGDRLFVLLHVLEAAAAVVVEDGVVFVQLDGPAELGVRVGVVLQLIVDHALGVVDWGELGVDADESVEAVHGFLVVFLPLEEESQVVEGVHIGGVQLDGHLIVLLLPLDIAQFLVA